MPPCGERRAVDVVEVEPLSYLPLQFLLPSSQTLAAHLCSSTLYFHLHSHTHICLLYTSDAADEEDSVDLGGRRIIKKKKKEEEDKKRENKRNKRRKRHIRREKSIEKKQKRYRST
eukprot:TRINITY_DN21497_c0_g1_i4.p1 TRINITY_DN21497_c0_g1~~TRINITY_DN21497_c0_g1_i4.p1  ORF type:complete len:116 (-),score=11.95 TRINITY_DN21497_c0_g1_i4:6-353(-)